jgi:hypothetical protein
LFHDVLGEGAEFGGGACAGEGAGDGDVEVEIGECCGAEPGEVVFDPFCGADEGVFFGVPGGEDTVLQSAYVL